MDFSFLLTTTYWFDPRPTIQSHLYIPLTIVFGVLVIAGLAIALLLQGELKKLWHRFFPALLIPGIIGFVYLFGRYEQLPYLASRFTLALILLSFFVWTFILLLWSAKNVPGYIKNKQTEENFNKYLPKKK